jgi:DNA-3-methyladenine glycosylase II
MIGLAQWHNRRSQLLREKNTYMLPSFMTQHLHTQDDLAQALAALAKQDPRLRPVLALTGVPALRRRQAGFAGLASTICGQQLSTSAAAAIWARVTAAFDPFHHDKIRRARADRLGRLGLSAAKIKTLKLIAAEIAADRLDLEMLSEAPADEAHAALVALHGIGPWTADIYLLFCLGHGDAWPAGDLAIQEAIKLAFGLDARPGVKQMATIGDIWRPWRGAAAHLFWAYYKIAKAPGFEAAPPIPPSSTTTKSKAQRAVSPRKPTTPSRATAKSSPRRRT